MFNASFFSRAYFPGSYFPVLAGAAVVVTASSTPSVTVASGIPIFEAERTVNLYRSTVDVPGAAKPVVYLFGTPGLKRIGTVGTSSTRGRFTQDGRTWSVIGAQLYEETFDPVTGAATTTMRGTIPNDGAPVSMVSNGDGGQQLAIVGGGQLAILSLLTNALTNGVALPLTRLPVMIGYLDGYFILSEANSPILWFSNIENGLVWDALDFFTRSTASDHVVAMICANNRVWVFGSETSEAYEDVGDALNPFQPIKGSLFQIGIVGPWAASVGVNTMRWIGRSSRGGAVMYRLDGYNGTRISNHTIESALARASTLADAELLTYEETGHLFCAATCPSAGVAGETWVIDEIEGQWHQRSTWNQALGREEMWSVRGHAYVGSVHVVGTRTGNGIFALDRHTYDEDGQMIRSVKRWPQPGPENTYAFLDRVELGVEAGMGLAFGQGSDPQIELRVSKDGGKTWFSAGTAALGAMGEYDTRVFWTRMGRVRVDRTSLEVVITDPITRVFMPDLWVTATPGRSMVAA